MTRFQLMGELNPEFLEQSQRYLMQVGMNIEEFNTLIEDVLEMALHVLSMNGIRFTAEEINELIQTEEEVMIYEVVDRMPEGLRDGFEHLTLECFFAATKIPATAGPRWNKTRPTWQSSTNSWNPRKIPRVSVSRGNAMALRLELGEGLLGIEAVKPDQLNGHHEDETVEAEASEFQVTLDRIRNIYLSEVSALQRHIHRLSSEKMCQEREVHQLREENEVLKSPVSKVGAMMEANPTDHGTHFWNAQQQRVESLQSSRLSGSGEHKPMSGGISAAMAKQRQHHKEVHAEDVIHAMNAENDRESEKDNIVELFKETEMRKLIKKENFVSFYPSETDSEKERRLASMTRGERCAEWLQSHQYEMTMAMCLCVNVICMASELQFYGGLAGYELGIYGTPEMEDGVVFWETFFKVADMMFTILFAVDVLIRIFFLRLRFWKTWLNYVDVGVAVTSVVEITVLWASNLPVNPVLFRLLRIGKLARAIRMVTMTNKLQSLQLLVKCLASSASMLFWILGDMFAVA
eukprot:symbB.v1.2.021063.t1/scaffold1802.1/size105105/1